MPRTYWKACVGVVFTMVFGLQYCLADRLIFLPTATKIKKKWLQSDWFFNQTGKGRTQGYIGTGIGDTFDGEAIYEEINGRDKVASVSFSYNYITPVVDLTPGVSVGVQDLMNRTKLGRYAYIAVTQRIGLDQSSNSDIPAEFTMGLATAPMKGAFFSIMLPVSERLRFMAEHNGLEFTAGVEVRPLRSLGIRWLFQTHQTSLGVHWLVKL